MTISFGRQKTHKLTCIAIPKGFILEQMKVKNQEITG